MTTSSRYKAHWWQRLSIGTITLVVVALLFAILLVVAIALKAKPDNQGEAGLIDPVPIPSTSVTAHKEYEHDQDVDEVKKAACESWMTADELASFKMSVMDYEEVYQSPPSAQKTELLSSMTTIQYQQDHKSTVTEENSDTIVTLLRDKTNVVCNIKDDGSRLASSLVVIQTSFINDSGEVEIIYPELEIPVVHYSTWVEDGGKWKVSSEE